jgi:hypothetical protein
MDLVKEYWQQIVAFLGVLIWLVRLEAMAINSAKEIGRLDEQRKEDLHAAREARASTNAKLDRMDDKLDRAFSEVRSDIKTLLSRSSSSE